MNRLIVLPEEINKRLKTLRNLDFETSGALICRRERGYNHLKLKAQAIRMTGKGRRFSVTPDPRREQIIDDFLQENPNYGAVYWHTHPSESGIGEADKTHYFERLREDKDYIAMIFNRKGRVLVQGLGRGNLETVSVPTPRDFYVREAELKRKLDECAKSLGYDNLPRL